MQTLVPQAVLLLAGIGFAQQQPPRSQPPASQPQKDPWPAIQGCSQDPWIYRADWAYCGAVQKGRRTMFSSRGKRTSLLKRNGYMGRRNPDLARR